MEERFKIDFDYCALVDSYEELPMIHFNDKIDFDELCKFLNKQEERYWVEVKNEAELMDIVSQKDDQIYHLEQIVAWFTGLLKFYDVNGDKQ